MNDQSSKPGLLNRSSTSDGGFKTSEAQSKPSRPYRNSVMFTKSKGSRGILIGKLVSNLP